MGKKILAIHTGGLQGVTGINQKLKKKKSQTLLYSEDLYINDFYILISVIKLTTSKKIVIIPKKKRFILKKKCLIRLKFYNKEKFSFILHIQSIAKDEMRAHKIPASITSYSILESGMGYGRLAKEGIIILGSNVMKNEKGSEFTTTMIKRRML